MKRSKMRFNREAFQRALTHSWASLSLVSHMKIYVTVIHCEHY